MKTATNVKVTFNKSNKVIEGMVIKYEPCKHIRNNGVVWFMDKNQNQFKAYEGWDQIEETPTASEEQLNKILALYKSKKATQAGVRLRDYFITDNGEDGYIISINHTYYNVTVEIYQNGKFGVETVNQFRKHHEDGELRISNSKEIAKFATLAKYLDKFLD